MLSPEIGVAFQAVGGELNLVQDWPGNANTQKVPSEISYSLATDNTTQWGGDFSPDSTKLQWTKLELDEQKRSDELNTILDALKGTNNLDFSIIQQSQGMPSYPAKDPVDVIADYLEKVRESLWRDLLSTVGAVVLDTIPVDLVFTVPAVRRSICETPIQSFAYKWLRFGRTRLKIEHSVRFVKPALTIFTSRASEN
jgi:hypothetical protein